MRWSQLGRPIELFECPYCRQDFRKHVAPLASTRWASRFSEFIRCGHANLGNTFTVEPSEYFAALSVIAQLFLRASSRKLLLLSRWRLAAALPSLEYRNAQEYPIAVRRALVWASADILEGWPNHFLEVASLVGLARQHFAKSRALQPAWMTELIDASLTRQRRGTTSADVEVAKAKLLSVGIKPTRARVQRMCGTVGATAVDDSMRLRPRGTRAELSGFLGDLHGRLHAPSISRRARQTLARDIIVILLRLQRDVPVDVIRDYQECKLIDAMIWAVDHEDPAICAIARSAWAILYAGPTRIDIRRPLHLQKGRGPGWSRIQTRLSASMAILDPRLRRNPAVFRWLFAEHPTS